MNLSTQSPDRTQKFGIFKIETIIAFAGRKDNEPTISNGDFIESVFEAVQDVFDTETVLYSAIRVSHPVALEIAFAAICVFPRMACWMTLKQDLRMN